MSTAKGPAASGGPGHGTGTSEPHRSSHRRGPDGPSGPSEVSGPSGPVTAPRHGDGTGWVGRCWHAGTAVAVLAALVVQVLIAVHAPALPAGHTTGLLRGTDLTGRLVRVASFFTVQSNVLVAATCAVLAVRPGVDGRAWRALRLTALTAIVVTGVVYAVALAPVHHPAGAAEVFVNTVVHQVVPLAAVAGWVVFDARPRSGFAVLGWVLVHPALWIGCTAVRGAVSGWYPYPFVDVAALGVARVAVNGVGVVVLLVAVAAGLCWVDRAVPGTRWASRRRRR